jgi:hypothetical protein
MGGPPPSQVPVPPPADPAGKGPVATLPRVDLEYTERTVARLHLVESTFDWVGVYVLRDRTLELGPYRGIPTEHERIASKD